MRTRTIGLILLSQLSLFANTDSNGTKLETMSVIGDGYNFPTVVLKDTSTAKTVVSGEALKRAMGAGGSNIFKAVAMAPSVNVQADGPYGLNGGTIKVRGYTERELGFELDGIPLNDSGNYAIYPHEYTDAENLYSVALTRGLSETSAPFYSDIGGSLTFKTKLPTKDFGVQIDQTFGSFALYRGFYRIDSGELSTGTKVFASYSHTSANKWKGSGESPAFRDHIAFGLTQEIGSATLNIFYDFNTQLNTAYKNRQLSYAKAQDFKNFYTLDNSANPIDGDYYKLNTNPYTNHALRANLVVPITDEVSFKFDPYLWLGEGGGYYSFGAPNKITYRNSLNYTNRPGFTTKVDATYDDLNVQAGLWYEYSDLKNFSNQFNGTNGDDILNNLPASFTKWRYIQRTYTTTTMPFVSLKQKNLLDMIDVTLGLKYANIKRDVTSYDTRIDGTTIGYYNDDNIYSHLGGISAKRTYVKTYDKLLPRAELGLNVNNNTYAYISYAQTFLVPVNSQGGSSNAQEITNNLKPQEADTFNLGLRYTKDNFFVTPGVYYSKYTNKIITVPTEEDPNVSNPQNVGESTAYGFELESGVNITSYLNLYGSYGYTKATYGNDYNDVKAEGNQLVDTPEHTFNTAVTYTNAGFSGTVSAKYISSRYGDATNTQSVDGYTIIDVNARQELELMGTTLTVTASVQNLADVKYIGRIATGDKRGSYYAGTPLAATLGLSGKF